MKKILILLSFVFLCLAGFSQAGNDTTKYTYYQFMYGEKFNRIWGLNVVDLPNDTTYSKYGIARKHDSVYVGNGIKWKFISSIGGTNIYNSDGRFNIGFGSTRTINAAGAYLVFDSVVNPTIAMRDEGGNRSRWTLTDSGHNAVMTIGQFTGGGGGIKQAMHIDVGSNNFLTGGSVPFGSLFLDSGLVSLQDQFGNYIFMASASFGQPGMSISPVSGLISIYNLPHVNDSTNWKPVVINNLGQLKQSDGWPGGGGGGADVVTTITSGTSSTVPAGTNIIRFNSTGVLTYTLTLPATWHASNDLVIAFTSNGTITNGNLMVNLTVVNGSGHTLSYSVSPNASYNAGEILRFHLISTIEQRYN